MAGDDGRGGEKEEDFPFHVFFLPLPFLRVSRRLMMSILLECLFKREFYRKQRDVKGAQQKV